MSTDLFHKHHQGKKIAFKGSLPNFLLKKKKNFPRIRLLDLDMHKYLKQVLKYNLAYRKPVLPYGLYIYVISTTIHSVFQTRMLEVMLLSSFASQYMA